MKRVLGIPLAAAVAIAALGGAALSQSALTVKFTDPSWDGKRVPKGQQCTFNGGHGATPALEVSGLPTGTVTINLAFSDETYTPMGDGGHGVLAFTVTPKDGVAMLPSVPGQTANLPVGVTIAIPNRTTGKFASLGYMPPCSTFSGNTYSVTATALNVDGKELAAGTTGLGDF